MLTTGNNQTLAKQLSARLFKNVAPTAGQRDAATKLARQGLASVSQPAARMPTATLAIPGSGTSLLCAAGGAPPPPGSCGADPTLAAARREPSTQAHCRCWT